jgi:hypothetical protein
MSWRAPVFALLLAGGAAWVACADFSSNDPPVDADAGAIGTEASVEAGDAGGSISDSGALGCARFSDASFCVDFEQPDALSGMVWTAPRTSTEAGTVTVTTERSVSPTHAASFVMVNDGSSCNFLVLERNFSGDHQSFRARVSASIEVAGWFFVVSSHPIGDVAYAFLVSIGEQAITLLVQENSDGGPYTKGQASVPFDTTPLGTFQEIMVEIDVPTHRAKLTVGTRTAEAMLPIEYTTVDPRLTLGPFCHNGGQRVLIDDVAAWVTP